MGHGGETDVTGPTGKDLQDIFREISPETLPETPTTAAALPPVRPPKRPGHRRPALRNHPPAPSRQPVDTARQEMKR